LIKAFKTNKNPPELINNLLEEVAAYDDLFTYKPQKPTNKNNYKYYPDDALIFRNRKYYNNNNSNHVNKQDYHKKKAFKSNYDNNKIDRP